MLAPMSVFCATTRFFRNLPKLGRITRNRLNATLSLLYHLHRYRTSKTSDRERDCEALSRPISLRNEGRSSQPPRSKPL